LTFSAALEDVVEELLDVVDEEGEPDAELAAAVAEEPDEPLLAAALVADEPDAELEALPLPAEANELASPTMPPWTSDGDFELLVEPEACVYASRVSPEDGGLMTAVMPLWQCLAKPQKSQMGSVELTRTEKAPWRSNVSNTF
jgi:hypothetical protein